MGIPGLKPFLGRDGAAWERVYLHNTPVIFDASSFIACYYFKSKLPIHYGGELLNFAVLLKGFLQTLIECKIQPIFTFDGCRNISGNKLPTLKRLAQEDIDAIAQFITTSTYKMNSVDWLAETSHFPKTLGLSDVLIGLLDELKLNYIFCQYEGDKPAAELAIHLNFFVVSENSDFFIFQSESGKMCRLITTSSIVSTAKKVPYHSSPRNSLPCFALECMAFDVNESSLSSIHSNKLIPLIPVLLGNDVIETKSKPQSIQARIGGRRPPGVSYKSWRTEVTIEWLSSFGNDHRSILNELFRGVPAEVQSSFIKKMLECVSYYRVAKIDHTHELSNFSNIQTQLTLTNIQNVGSDDQILQKFQTLSNKDSIDKVIDILNGFDVMPQEELQIMHGWPENMIEGYRKGRLSHLILNSLCVKGGTVIGPLMEDVSLRPSVSTVAKRIRELEYRLMWLSARHNNLTHQLSGIKNNKITEIQRSGSGLTEVDVDITMIELPRQKRVFDALEVFFFQQLSLDLKALSGLDSFEKDLSLLLAFWFRQSSTIGRCESFSNNSIALAFVTIALAMKHAKSTLFSSSKQLDEAIATFSSMCGAEGAARGYGAQILYSIRIVHQITELRLVFINLKQLVELFNVVHSQLVEGSCMSTSILNTEPVWTYMPNGRSFHMLARTLESLNATERWSHLRDEFEPLLVSKKLITSRSSKYSMIESAKKIFDSIEKQIT